MYSSTLSLTSALDEWVVNATAWPLYRQERPGTRCIGGTRPGRQQGRSGRVRKISPTPEFDPRTVQPVASRYTDRAIPERQWVSSETTEYLPT